jgi:putative transposase
MKKPIQYSLLKSEVRFFGGSLLRGRRKAFRPLSTKDPIHLVMRSVLAKGSYSFLRPENRKAIENILGAMGKRFQIRIYRIAVQGNHIHLIIKIEHRVLYKAFIKALSGKIAQAIMKAKSFDIFLEKLNPPRGGDGEQRKGFWEFRPFTRVLHWGRDYRRTCAYLEQNILEAVGFSRYKPRKNYYARWIKEIAVPSG